jgi:hypothetical protein
MSSTELVPALSTAALDTLEQVRDNWRSYGLATGPTDRAACQAAIVEAYKAVGMQAPRIFIWLKSPWQANTAAKLIESNIDWPFSLSTAQYDTWEAAWKGALKQVEAARGPELWQAERKRIRQEAEKKVMDKHGFLLDTHVKDEFALGMGISIWRYMRTIAGKPVYSRIREQAEGAVKAAIAGKLSSVVEEQIYHELVQPVHQQVWSYVAEPLKQQVPAMAGVLAGVQKWECGYGQHDAGWLSYYYFIKTLGIGGTEPLEGLFKMAQSGFWWWPFENVCVLSDRPLTLARDNRNRLHHETDMCMRFGDGWGLYAWRGVLVPPYVVLLPEPLTFDLIESERNAEVRRVLIERYGLDNYLREGKVLRLHEDQCGILYRMNLPGDEPILVVRVQNSTPEPDGTIKEYFLRVPPTMQRARQAVAWTFGLSEEEYHPLTET